MTTGTRDTALPGLALKENQAPVTNPDDPDDAVNYNGGLLPSPRATLAGPTFAEWLGA